MHSGDEAWATKATRAAVVSRAASNRPGIVRGLRCRVRIQRLESLTGVRAFAALLVFAFHAPLVFQVEDRNPWGAASAGMSGVSAFYILSGFVLAWTARPPDGLADFCRRRAARIYPAYVAACLAGVLLLLATGVGVGLSDLPALFLIQAWWPAQDVHYGISPAFWSLSCEAFFYATFPLLIRFLVRMSGGARRVAIGVLASVPLVLAVSLHPLDESSTRYWLLYLFPLSRLPEFLLGCLLGLEVLRGARSPVGVPLALGVSLAAVLAASQVPLAFRPVVVTLIPFSLLVLACARTDLRARGSFFRRRLVVKVGVWSYAFYLLHGFVLIVAAEILSRLNAAAVGGPSTVLPAVVVALCVSLGAAFALHRFVERPAEAWLRPTRRYTVDRPIAPENDDSA
jgi:peptidoglycan/LPS O-acetylase OafA/YrhL